MIDRALFRIPGARSMIMGLVGLDVLQALLIIGQALFLSQSITGLWQGHALKTVAGPIAYFALCFIGRQLINWFNARRLDDFAGSVAKDMRKQLLQKVFALGPEAVAKKGTGSMVTVTLDGISNVEDYLQLTLSKIVTMMITPVMILIAVAFLNWQSAAIMLVIYPLIILFMIILGYAAQARADRQYENFQHLSNNFIDSLRGIDTLKYFGLSKRYSNSIFKSSESFRKSTMDVLKVAMLSTFALDFFTTLSIAIVAVYLGFGLIDAEIPLFPALATLILAPDYFLPIRNFANDYHATLDGKNSFRDVMEIIGQKQAPAPEFKLHAWQADDQLEINDLAFRYHEGGKIAPLSVRLRGYQKVGIIGMSGSGKTTLINLLAGFLTPEQGEIKFQDQTSATMNIADWQHQITYIPQSPYVFAASLRDNVAFYTPGVSDEEVKDAIHVVGLDDLLADLPAGLDTMIGGGKRALSGGQAQRIALARAFLDHKRRVMIFDEPTAHLDIETELDLKERMLPLMENRLVFFATHRLHWMKKMDYILVMDHGQLVEQGTYQELLAKNGYFTKLIQQTKGEGEQDVQ